MNNIILMSLTILTITPILLYTNNNANTIILDTSKYDPNFNWYNTNGTLPIIRNNTVIFHGSNLTNMYQDAISIISIKPSKYIELNAKVSFIINDYSNNAKDEFAIFATSDIKEYNKHEFGFVLPENNDILYAYVQSPEINGFFIWKPIMYIDDNLHELKAIYDNSKVRFYIDNMLVWEYKFIILKDRLHLAIVSHKLSNNIDISNNKMIIYNASLLSNL